MIHIIINPSLLLIHLLFNSHSQAKKGNNKRSLYLSTETLNAQLKARKRERKKEKKGGGSHWGVFFSFFFGNLKPTGNGVNHSCNQSLLHRISMKLDGYVNIFFFGFSLPRVASCVP